MADAAETGRDQARTLSGSVRFMYGLGLSAEGVKNNAFNLFLLFYYQQVAHLSAVLTGIALFIALCFDAITDPLVGLWSDGFSSRHGRRHPFMFAASIPLGLCFFAVFNPPAGASVAVLFAWLLSFACGTRFAMTLFAIPHQALVAELTEDYEQRTRLQSGRTVFAWLFGLLNALLAYTVFLKATSAYPYDPAGFPAFALWGALVMVLTTALSSVGTRKAALAEPRKLHEPVLLGLQSAGARDLYPDHRGGVSGRAGRGTPARQPLWQG